MVPAIPPGANRIFTAPPNWDVEKHGPCHDLHLIADPSVPSLTSIWVPSPEELTMLNEGGFVMLAICGTQMPPVIVTACTC